MVRQSSNYHLDWKDNDKIDIIQGDITDINSLRQIFRQYSPNECYNLASTSHPGLSFNQPLLTTEVNGIGVLNLLETIKEYSPDTKLCQISSADIFAGTKVTPQNENTPITPISPYGAAKAYAYNLCEIYKKAYNLYCSNIIAYNHESPRRSDNFVTKKIISYAVKFSYNNHIEPLKMGNIEAKRPWGDVREFVRGYHASLQQPNPENYLLSAPYTLSVKNFITKVFQKLDYKIIFDRDNNGYVNGKKQAIKIDNTLYRPADYTDLVGDTSKARYTLYWEHKTNIDDLVTWLVDSEIGVYENANS
jgi:GDPmannose 4,6-dehydratase